MTEDEVISLAGRHSTWEDSADGSPADAPRLHAGALYASPLPTGARLQEFEITAVIGQGGFGIVYLARDLSLQRSVAIKEYMPAHLAGRNAESAVRPLTAGQAEVFELGRRSFIDEARMLARFKHPGLVEVLRFWEQNGTAYMAMPYYDGATLTQYLKRHPGIATETWLRQTLTPLMDALGHMHEENCFHRDVAPDNILILKDGSAVLLDLGAARRVIASDAQAMTVLLKPGYAPIEQYSDDPRSRQGPWTDIYAMAAVFFFAITGKAPPASASRVMRDSVSPLHSVRPAGFSPSFLLAVDRGLALQPDDRPRSIAEFRSLLFSDRDPQGPSAQSTARRAEARVSRRSAGLDSDGTSAPPVTEGRMARRIGAALVLSALILAGTWYALKPSGFPKPAPDVADVRPAPRPGVTGSSDKPARGLPGTAAPPAGSAAAAPSAAGKADPVADAAPGASPTSDPESPDRALAAPSDPLPGASPDRAPAVPSTEAAPAVPAAPPAPVAPATYAAGVAEAGKKPSATATGTVALAVTPWAEIRVDGVARGVSPPIKQLTLPVGRHTIEFRNPASTPVKQQVEVRANQNTVVRQQF